MMDDEFTGLGLSQKTPRMPQDMEESAVSAEELSIDLPDQKHSYSGLLRQTFKLFFTRLGLFSGVAAVPALVNGVCFFVVLGGVQIVTVRAGIENQGVRFLDLWDYMGPTEKVVSGLVAFSSMLIFVWFQAAAITAASKSSSAGATSFIAAYRSVRMKGLRLFVFIWILGVLPVIGWLLAFACVPALPIAVLENRGVADALREAATSGDYVRRFLVWLLCWITVLPVLGLTLLVVGTVAVALPLGAPRAVVFAIAIWTIAFVTLPPTIALTLSYLGSRVQHGSERRVTASGTTT